MSDANTNPISAIGLDIGTSRIVAARRNGHGLRFESQLNAFVDVPFNQLIEHSLKKEQIPYSKEGNTLLVHGNAAEKFADMMNGEIRRPMVRGVLNPGEPESVRVIRDIARMLAGKSEGNGEVLCFTVPAAPLGNEENLTYHEATLKEVMGELGFTVKSINEGLAVIYSELESTNYTGIGISCGGGLCNVCFAYLSLPIISFSIPKAGDFIDASAATTLGERANRVRLLKEESFYLNGTHSNKMMHALGVYYDDMIYSLAAALKDAFTNGRSVPKLDRPIPMVLSGGTSMPKGFRDRMEKVLQTTNFPVQLSEIRVAENPLTTTAKGALIAALCDRS